MRWRLAPLSEGARGPHGRGRKEGSTRRVLQLRFLLLLSPVLSCLESRQRQKSSREATMRLKTLVTCVSMAACVGLAVAVSALMSASAHAQAAAARSGQVSSAEEGAIEGVMVSAKKGTIAITVASDSQGRYSFPQDRLEPGRYTIAIRAGGYNLVRPKEVEVTAGTAAT